MKADFELTLKLTKKEAMALMWGFGNPSFTSYSKILSDDDDYIWEGLKDHFESREEFNHVRMDFFSCIDDALNLIENLRED